MKGILRGILCEITKECNGSRRGVNISTAGESWFLRARKGLRHALRFSPSPSHTRGSTRFPVSHFPFLSVPSPAGPGIYPFGPIIKCGGHLDVSAFGVCAVEVEP